MDCRRVALAGRVLNQPSVTSVEQSLRTVAKTDLDRERLFWAKQQCPVQQSVVIFNTITSPQFCQGFALCRRYPTLSPDETSNLPLRAYSFCQR